MGSFQPYLLWAVENPLTLSKEREVRWLLEGHKAGTWDGVGKVSGDDTREERLPARWASPRPERICSSSDETFKTEAQVVRVKAGTRAWVLVP